MPKFALHLFQLLLLLPCWQEAQAVPGKSDIVVNVERQGEHFRVDASVVLPVPSCQSYALLTDYASLPAFIPGLLEVGFTRMGGSKVRVRQVGETKLLFFNFRMELLLEMDEIPDRHIRFKLIEGNMDEYSGAWDLQPTPEGTLLHYTARLKFQQYIPTFPGKRLLAAEALERFEALGKEAAARKNRQYPSCTVAK